MIVAIWLMAMMLCSEPGNKRLQKDVVQVQASKALIEKGKTGYVMVEVTVEEGYHIQADRVNDEFLIPASLKVFPINGLKIYSPEFPSYKLFRLEGTTVDLNVFDGKFTIKVPVKAKPEIPLQSYTLKAAFHYQACNHKSCLFPRTINFEMEVAVE